MMVHRSSESNGAFMHPVEQVPPPHTRSVLKRALTDRGARCWPRSHAHQHGCAIQVSYPPLPPLGFGVVRHNLDHRECVEPLPVP
jgi:hypothetical protein